MTTKELHAPLKCNQCGVPLAFIKYGTKMGSNGKEAKWPIYEKCSNPACSSGAKHLKAEGKLVPHPAKVKAKIAKAEPDRPVYTYGDPATKPELNAIGAKHAKKAAALALGKGQAFGVRVDTKTGLEEVVKVDLQITKVEAVIPTLPADETKSLENAVARNGRVVGLPDRATYRFYQLDAKRRMNELLAICQAYKPGSIKMVQADLETLLMLPENGIRVEKLGTEYQLVSPAGIFPIALIRGLTTGYFYVAADPDKKLVPSG